ncbi:MAG: T9SS type A sorting domain-containing protein [Bacteroidales bacterium]|nr:T9SS type A sorting domain-containing protein [Bacteroidales bacterium]
MKKISQFLFFILFISYTSSVAKAQILNDLSFEQGAYDVNYYNLDLAIDPISKTIKGSLLCRAKIINSINTLTGDPLNTFVLNLYDSFSIDSILFKINDGVFSSVNYTHTEKLLNISIPENVSNNDFITAQVFYNGAPQIAVNPPWGGGFVWSESTNGEPWIGVACETIGAAVWWPCKDHSSDEPDSMSISFTVPNPLICVSNGKYMGNIDNGNNTSTFNWFVSTPINNYNVTFYAAEYMLIEDDYESTIGNTIPFYFWVLPEAYDKAMNHMDVFKSEFDFLETTYGPYPFGTDKHGWAHAPYFAMEHQTIIAYGYDFTTDNDWGFDFIHLHELAHEWWGNFITAKSWTDLWIHEGIATYTEALLTEHLFGKDRFFEFMKRTKLTIHSIYPLAPQENLTLMQVFLDLQAHSRGACVLHTLRYHLGDESFFELLKRWAYSDSTDFDNTKGRLCRVLSTDDMKELAQEITNRDLEPFFEVFFREVAYPSLNVLRKSDSTIFTWETENNIKLDVNIPVLVNGEELQVEMIEGQGALNILLDDDLVIDPNGWILMNTPSITVGINENIAQIKNYNLAQNYPNPFHISSTIKFTIPEFQFVTLKVYNLQGVEVLTLINEELNPGIHEVSLNGNKLISGTYFYRLQAGEFLKTKSLIVN